ncbi:TlpA disulfide reductase family protein [Prevotella sp. 10(H)]|uniref:TlpA family protein disulfide reductase n=1 Tax=Prevotella sp. 10(H) TaxID=1158294 RepID=UPI0004A758F1|nr:TlpA disulfide reductase family protein [Prevotella sp. 10(H)]
MKKTITLLILLSIALVVRVQTAAAQMAGSDDPVLKSLTETPVSEEWMTKLEPYAQQVSADPDDALSEIVFMLYARMTDADKKTPAGKKIKDILLPALLKEPIRWQPAIDADFKDLDGNAHKLSDLKGKYVLLDFWASWCGPCIKILPQINEVKEKYKDKLHVVSLNLDGDIDIWKRASEKHNIKDLDWSDGGTNRTGVFTEYKGVSIPYFILISPDGNVMDRWEGYVYNQGNYIEKRITKYMK